MYTLIVLATMTSLGSFTSQASCQSAVRHIYEQKIDPYQMMAQPMLKQVVDMKMKYNAPREYRCQKV